MSLVITLLLFIQANPKGKKIFSLEEFNAQAKAKVSSKPKK